MLDGAVRPVAGRLPHWPVAVPLALFGLGALRVATMLWSGAGLHVDEAQYWDWSRGLQWGYYSKPPGVAALIAASTSVFGNGVLGVRVLAMACWLFSSLVIWRLGAAMGSEISGRWAALCLAATPASGLLGLVATTDAPLMLFWSLAMYATWRALHAERSVPWWLAVGVALGLGLLAKYTMAAMWITLAWLVWKDGRRSTLTGLVIGSAAAVIVLLPNLWWNDAHGWPTLRHTAEITVGAAVPRGTFPVLSSVGEYLAGQLLLAGPALIGLVAFLSRRRAHLADRHAIALASDRKAFSLAFVLPLVGIGLLQALHARAQMNWTAPALLGLCLWVGWQATVVAAPSRWLTVATLVGVGMVSLVAGAGDLRRLAPRPDAAASSWDVWERMRGWDDALNELRPALKAHPGLPVLADSRNLIAHARYAWRDLERPVQAIPFDGPPRNHYEMLAGPAARSMSGPWLLLSAGPPAPAQFGACAGTTPLAEGRSGRVAARLWLMTPAVSCGIVSP